MTEYLLRTGCALATGMLVGTERQYRQRNAGLRTNMLVAVGSAAFTVLSCAITAPGYGDPARIAAQIVSGIGFLGGGLILKEGFNVRGLNTAATIWCSAACGTLSGAGMYGEAFVLVGCVLLTHLLFRPLSRMINRRSSDTGTYTLRAECRAELSETVRQTIMQTLASGGGVRMNSLFYREGPGPLITVCCEAEADGSCMPLFDLVVARLRAHFGVVNAGWERQGVPTHHEEF